MVTDRELMQQALEALENAEDQLPKPYSTDARAAITALRERLAQPVQEPKLSCGVDFADGLLTVSVGRICADGSMEVIHCEQIEIPVQEPVGQLQEDAFGRGQVLWFNKPADESMLYTAPQPRQWQGLADEEIKQIELSLRQYNSRDTYDLSLKDFARAIETKLREKNGGGV